MSRIRSRTSGVETEAASRFVDYTVVSPWEELVAWVERAVLAHPAGSSSSGDRGGRGSPGAGGQASSEGGGARARSSFAYGDGRVQLSFHRAGAAAEEDVGVDEEV